MKCAIKLQILLVVAILASTPTATAFFWGKKAEPEAPLRIWIDTLGFGAGETTFLREAIEASNGHAVLHGETNTPFLTPKGWHNIKDVDVYWTNRKMCYTAFRQPQVTPAHAISCVPGIRSISGKADIVKTMTAAYGDKAFSIIPTSYLLPQQFYSFAKHVLKERQQIPWVLKADRHRGKGVIVAQGPDVLKTALQRESGMDSYKYVVAQRFMKDQYLVNGRPFYIRVWAVVAGGSPLRTLLYNGGVVVFGEEQTNKNKTSGGDSMIVNLFLQDRKAAAPWGVPQLREHMGKEFNSSDVFEKLWQQMEDSIAATVAAAAPSIRRTTSKKAMPSYHQAGFEYLGVDFLVDADLKPWIIEVNSLPSLAKKVIGCDDKKKADNKSNQNCQTENPFDVQKANFVTALLDLFMERRQGRERRQQQASTAIAEYVKEYNTTACISSDQLRRVLDVRHESSIAEKLGFSLLNNKIMSALHCISELGAGGKNNAIDETNDTSACATVLPQNAANNNNIILPASRGMVKTILRYILRRLPIIKRYIPKTFAVGNAVSEYDVIIKDWIERHDGDEEMDVNVLLNRMCNTRSFVEENELDLTQQKDEL